MTAHHHQEDTAAMTTTDEITATWNAAVPIGTPVRYWKGIREGDGRVTRTRTEAQLLGGHTPVVWLDGVSGCIALTHVEPITEEELAAAAPADCGHRVGPVAGCTGTRCEPNYVAPSAGAGDAAPLAGTRPPLTDLDRATTALHHLECGCPDWDPASDEAEPYRNQAAAVIEALRVEQLAADLEQARAELAQCQQYADDTTAAADHWEAQATDLTRQRDDARRLADLTSQDQAATARILHEERALRHQAAAERDRAQAVITAARVWRHGDGEPGHDAAAVDTWEAGPPPASVPGPRAQEILDALIGDYITTACGTARAATGKTTPTEQAAQATIDRLQHLDLAGWDYRLTPQIVEALRRAGRLAVDTTRTVTDAAATAAAAIIWGPGMGGQDIARQALVAALPHLTAGDTTPPDAPDRWEYALPDPDEPDGVMPMEGTPRLITPRMLRRPLRAVGPWVPAEQHRPAGREAS